MVTNSTGVSTQVSRTVIVMGSNISISLDNEKITNGSVGINVYVVDNYFDYMILPNGNKVNDKKYTYQVNENGEYKFSIYDKLGKSQEKSILVSNIDKEAPNGSCTGLYGNGKTSINIKAVDNTGISKYVVNGRDYSSNNITLDKDYSSVSVVIYDKAGNSKSINCSMKEDIIKYESKFELYSISPSNGVKMSYWVNVPEGAHDNGRLVMFLHADGAANRPYTVKEYIPVNFPEKYQGDKYILIAPVANEDDWTRSATIRTRGAMPVSCCGRIDGKNFKNMRVLAISGTSGQEGKYISCMQKNVDKILAAGGVADKITYPGYGHGDTYSKMDYQGAFDWLCSKE